MMMVNRMGVGPRIKWSEFFLEDLAELRISRAV